MEVLRFDGLGRSYGARDVFVDASGVLSEGATVGLVGPNGAGKSSLVRILAGLDDPDGGRLVRAPGSRCGYVSQTANADSGSALRDLLERAFERERAEEARLRDLERAVAEARDDGASMRALQRYGDAREAFDRHGGPGARGRLRAMLAAFDFAETDLDRPTGDFSGGQRTRATLARLLLEQPDYLILDEPTNHLDLETVRWLENFLIADARPALVVSHDRSFLDRIASEIWELDGGRLERYPVARGNAYERYLEAKTERQALAERAYERFRDEERRRQSVIAELRTHGSHNYSHVRSREKSLAKLERVAAPATSQASISVRLEAARRASGGLALSARGLAVAYNVPLFSGVDLDLERGERLALVGANGAGKSTLLDVLAGRRRPDRGTVTIREGMRAAYFAQDAADDLPPDGTAVEAVLAGAEIVDQQARALLGRLGLGGDAGDKPLDAFSGGERRRIMLARLMARAADLLFLDEPTNDLDIPSREALEAVLAAYDGAMVVVSHDRYLLRRLADRVLWLEAGQARLVDGGYDRFERDQLADVVGNRAARAATSPDGAPSAAKLEREARLQRERAARALEASEREALRLDAERTRLEAAFADPTLYEEPARVAELERELAVASAAADAALAKWEALAESA